MTTREVLVSRVTWPVLCAWMLIGCEDDRWDREPDPYDLDFDIPRTESFARTLSAYGLYEEPMASLQPTADVLPYELSSELFTDYAFKQRLMRVPEGASMTFVDAERAEFPEGTVLVKTFYYPLDMRAPAAAPRILETRLLVKTQGLWNVATYLWNAEQTDATLLLDGTTIEVSWIDEAGQARSTNYAVPHEGECVTCHQRDGESAFIGPSLQSLNRPILHGGGEINQLEALHAEGTIEKGDWEAVPTLVDYRDLGQPLERRARSYLDINCAHCHNPDGWDEASDRDVDFRYTTPLNQTGLRGEADELQDLLLDGEMPFLGTTLRNTEGIDLLFEYIETL